MFAIIATPSYDFHVNAWDNEQHRKMVAARNTRDLALIERRTGGRAWRAR